MNVKWRILVIEDDAPLALGLKINLEAEGFDVLHVLNAEDGLNLIEKGGIDLVVLDVMLPGMSGFEALKTIRADDLKLPILMLTARSDVEDRIEGFKSGADDYLGKPFHLEEFLLRIRRMLDRYEWYRSEGALQIGPVSVNFDTLEVTGTIQTIRITPHEANLIQYLAQYQDRIVTRSELLKNVWGLDPNIETRTVDTFISRIRRYLESDPGNPQHIVSVRGKGYRFVP